MSYKPNEMMEVPLETVDNLIESMEWIVCSINFWHIDKDYPTNLIIKVAADFMYEFRKLRASHDLKNFKKKNKK